MKKYTSIILLFIFCTSFFVACGNQGLENPSSLMSVGNSSILSSNELEESSSELSSEEVSSAEEILPLYTDIMPHLTPEEEAKVNDIVPLSVFDIEDKGRKEIYSETYEKDLKQMTYGELWRFTNRENPLPIEVICTDQNGNYAGYNGTQYQSSPICSEYKSVKSVIILPNGDILPEYFDSVWEMTWLEELTFQNRGSYSQDFGDMPEGFGNLKNLRRFNGDFSKIYSFPDVFDGFEQLEYFSCEWSYLEEMPPSFYCLPNLKELNLDANPLTLSPEIGNLQNLEILTLPSVETIPNEIGNLNNLKELSIKWTRHTKEEEIDNMVSMQTYKPVLPDKTYVLPEGIGGLENLEKLECWYVKDPLPESIGNLKNLEGLDLSGEITKLPESIGNLKNLAWIRISSELFTSLPESFGDLQSLTSINFTDDKLEETAWAMIEAKKQ